VTTDALVGTFRDQATDWRSWAAMVAGGLGYRLGRMGTMALGTGRIAAGPLQVLSVGVGLTSEVSAFELTHRGLTSALLGARSPRPQFGPTQSDGETPPLHPENPNLWRWSGPGGLRQGLLQSFITFGTLRGAGHLARGENLVTQHLLQNSSMVFGTQAAGALGIMPGPRGSLAEQFLHAEATNLQLGAAMSLGHRFAPGIHGLERGLDLSLRATNVGANLMCASNGCRDGRTQGSPLQNELQPALVLGTGPSPSRGHLVFSMSSGGDGKGGGGGRVISLEQWRATHTSPSARRARQRLIQQMVDASSLENVQEQIRAAMADWLHESPVHLVNRQLSAFEGALSRESLYFTKNLLLYVRTDPLLAKALVARLGLVPIDSPLYRDREVIGVLSVNATSELSAEELRQIEESTYSRFQVEMDSYYPERSSQIPSRKEWFERVGALPPILLRAWNSPLLIPDQFLHLAYRLGVSQIAIF